VPRHFGAAMPALSLGALCLAVSCGRSETSSAPDAGEPQRPDPGVSCARLAAHVRDTYGALRNHYDQTRWDELVARFDGERAATLRGFGQILEAAPEAGKHFIRAGAEPYNQAGRSSKEEAAARQKKIEALVMEARKNAAEELKRTDAKVAAFVAELERSTGPGCSATVPR